MIEELMRPPTGIELDRVAETWQVALDSATDALDASRRTYAPAELLLRRRRLAHERVETARELGLLAHDLGLHDTPWISTAPIHPGALGLDARTRACIFDLEGVLTDSGLLHAATWADVFDDFLLRKSETTGWQFVRFDPERDYGEYLDGRPRLEGIHRFLRSRGIQIAEGRPSDDASADTAYGLARRKGNALGKGLRLRGVNALPGARVYLEAAGHAGLGRAVVSSSTRTLPMLELAGLASLVEARVDAEQIASGVLRSRPAPDIVLRACELLEVEAASAVAFVRTADGVMAGHVAGVQVVGVAADQAGRARLRAFGADRVVARLADLIERNLREAAA